MRRVAAVALAMLAGAAVAQETRPMHHATGTFAVTMSPEAQAPAPEGGVATSRMGVAKTYAGALAATATGTMLAAGTPAPGQAAAYVAIEQVAGTLDGRSGGFVLVHRGTMTKAGGGDLRVEIAPDSGTGALAGIEGKLAIEVKDGKHFYDLAYTLPATR